MGRIPMLSLFGKLMGASAAPTFAVLHAAIGSDGIAVGTTLGVSSTFAALILRQVVKNQAAIWEIVRSKDRDNAKLRWDLEYTAWEREQARFRGKERSDPGPFQPSPALQAFMESLESEDPHRL